MTVPPHLLPPIDSRCSRCHQQQYKQRDAEDTCSEEDN
jgi:hypothetical protein